MVLGWRRAFCTSIPRDRDSSNHSSSSTISGCKQEKPSHDGHQSPPTTPKLSSKLSFFSNPSTPRLQSQPTVSSPRLRCRTTNASTSTPSTPPLMQPPESPKLHCKTAKNSPRFFQLRNSTPSSPRSPSTFSLLKSTLRISSKIRCGICLHSIKSGQGTAIFTAECNHNFHFPCVAGQVRKQGILTCPVCNSTWSEMPLLSIHNVHGSGGGSHRSSRLDKQLDKKVEFPSSPKTPPPSSNSCKQPQPVLKVYNDDEPLMSPTCGARFNPIPESDEYREEGSDSITEEFQGFYPSTTTSPFQKKTTAFASRNFEASILPDAAVISIGRSSQTFVVVLKIRAPPAPANAASRAPIDLVMVLDVSGKLTNEKLQMMKRALRLVVSSLSAADRLSIVAFSSTSKRLLPLRRMTTAGRRSARRIVDAIVSLDGAEIASASDAIRKAAKVLEDRRERNPVASIILLSDAIGDGPANERRRSSVVCTTRTTHYEVPVLSVGLRHYSAYGHAAGSDSSSFLSKCVEGLLSVVVQDLRMHLGIVSGSGHSEIAGVYSFAGRPVALGSGSVRVGEMFAGEERELLVELKVPSSSPSTTRSAGAHHVLSVRCTYKDPSTQGLIQGKEQALLVPRPQTVRSSTPSSIERLRSLFVATRAVAESRRLVERNDLAGAHHLLTSARSLVIQSSGGSGDEHVRGLEAELTELHWKRQNQVQQQIRRRQNVERRHPTTTILDEKSSEPLTPTSAWRAAERLAKVAIMRKSMNRVSDLHGFENARF